MVRWEYKVETGRFAIITTANLNTWGQEGWELVNAIPFGGLSQESYERFYFKRRID